MTYNYQAKVIGFPLFDKVTLLDFVGATQIFSDAQGFEPVWLAPEMRPYQTTEDTVNKQSIYINPHFTFCDPKRPRLDILFCPGGAAGYYDDSNGKGCGYVHAMFDKTYQDFVTQVANNEADCYGSVCTGAFVLAAAGLFDGCTATTYWSVIQELRRFPNITVPEGYPRVLINRKEGDGVEKVCFSGGGVSSSMDLALALVKHLSDDEQLAQETQLTSQYAPKPIINFGDPSEASQGMVEESMVVQKVRERQQEGIIQPTRCAVNKILNRAC